MQIHTSTDYAIRIILQLSKASTTISSSKLSSMLGVSQRYLLQIGARLRDAGFVSTTFGPNGGFTLNMTPREISLYDIITVMERDCQTREPRDKDEPLTEFKILKTAYKYVGTVLLNILKSITMDSLLNMSIEEWYLAPCLLDQEQGKGYSQ